MPQREQGTSLEAARLPQAARLVATAALMIASGMQAADATIANVALPRLEHELGGGVVLGAWVVTSYLCATAVVAPLTGWFRRRFGMRRLFIGTVGAFVVASLLCAMAQSGPAIILARIVQGAGGGFIHPLAQAILLDLYPRERHGRMLAIWGATVMVGPIIGPAVGGVITDLASWRWVFVINLPLGALAIWGMQRVLPEGERDRELRVDLLGIALLATAVAALQLCLERSIGRSWLRSPELLAEAAVAVLALVGMTIRARYSGFTVFRTVLFRNMNFAVAAFYNFTSSGLLFVAIVFIPALSQGPLAYNATVAGATLVPRGIATMLIMLGVGQMIGRVDFRILLASGMALMAAGLAILAAVHAADAVLWLVVGSTMQAFGGGILFTTLSTLAFSTLPPTLRTDATGVYSLLRQLGCAAGVTLMTAILRHDAAIDLERLTAHGAAPSAALTNFALLHAYSQSFRVMAIASLVLMPGVLLFRVGGLGFVPGSTARPAAND